MAIKSLWVDKNGTVSGDFTGIKNIDGSVVFLEEERFVQLRTVGEDGKEAVVFNCFTKNFQLCRGVIAIIKNWDDESHLRLSSE